MQYCTALKAIVNELLSAREALQFALIFNPLHLGDVPEIERRNQEQGRVLLGRAENIIRAASAAAQRPEETATEQRQRELDFQGLFKQLSRLLNEDLSAPSFPLQLGLFSSIEQTLKRYGLM